MNWKTPLNLSKEKKERNNKIWEFIRDFFIDFKTNLVIKILKKSNK